MWTFEQTQAESDPCGELWTVGRYEGGRWIAESDWATADEAAARAGRLNRGEALPATLVDVK